jgi:hypothetical protein
MNFVIRRQEADMQFDTTRMLAVAVVAVCGLVVASTPGGHTFAAAPPQSGAAQQVDLAERLTSGKLRLVNRKAEKIADRPGAIHVSEAEGIGLAWVDGSDFAEGTIEVDVRGRDLLQQSFLGVAFHGKNDAAYEMVYLRPFNFRANDPTRHGHAVQYSEFPDYEWPRLRKEFPEEFENPVDGSIVPTDWVSLKVVVNAKGVQIFVGPIKTPALEARKLGQLDRGLVGLWVGTNSDGSFANLRVTPAK